MFASCNAWIYGAVLLGIFLCGGCATPDPKPLLSTEAQAEALSCFSLSLLAKNAGDAEAALEFLKEAIRIDPTEMALYPSAVAAALQLQQGDEAFRLARQFRERRPDALPPRILEAQVLALTGRYEDAEALLRQTQMDFPQETDIAIALARLLIAQKRNSEAIQTLETARKNQPGNAEILYILGTLYVNQARNQEGPDEVERAILDGTVLLENALSLSPGNPQHWQQLGYAYLAIKDTEKAQSAFEKAHELSPEDVQLARQLLDLYILNGDIESAMKLCEHLRRYTQTDLALWFQYLVDKIPEEYQDALTAYLEVFLKEHPQAAVLYYAQLGSLYIDQKKLAEAGHILEKAKEIYPENDQLRMVAGYLNLRQENYEKAYQAFKQVQTDSPDSASNPLFTFHFIIASQKSGRIEEAAEALTSAYNKDPQILNFYIQAVATGQTPVSTQSAIDLLNRFLTRSPDAIEALYYLFLLQADQENYEEALSNARRFETLAAGGASANLLDGFFYYQYAVLHERTGKPDEAESFFRKAIGMGNPVTVASAQNYIAYMWAERGEKLEMALELIYQALAVEPDNAAFIDTLGWIYYRQGRYQEALVQLKKAGELTREDPEVWEHLGDIYLKLGDRERAIKIWNEGLRVDPDNQTLIERLEENGINIDNSPAPEDIPADTPSHP